MHVPMHAFAKIFFVRHKSRAGSGAHDGAITRADVARFPGSYLDSHHIVEKVVAEAKPGSIIPIRIGITDGGRDDYLYRELALLIDNLIAMGYQIVPISTLIEHNN